MPEDLQSLAERHAPLVVLDEAEELLPMGAGELVGACELVDAGAVVGTPSRSADATAYEGVPGYAEWSAQGARRFLTYGSATA